jgi:hypothetical protein
MRPAARVLIVAAIGVVVCTAAIRAADPPGDASTEVVAVRGRIVCLDAATATFDDPANDPCNQPGARFELRTSAAEVVHFLPEDSRAAIFTDPQVRAKEIEVRGWRRAGDAIEILSVHSIVAGVPHHLHYRCDVCNITTDAPGPCWCCGKPFELREEPAEGGDDAASNQD